MSDVITLANEIVKEKERIRQAIEYRGVTIPASTPFSDYHNKILSIDTQVEPSDLYYRDEDFDESLTSFTVPSNYESLMENSLSDYTNLQTLNLNYVKYIFDNACLGDTSLINVNGAYLKYIGNNAFIKTALTSFSNNSVEQIGNSVFKDTLIEDVELQNCKYIGPCAFMNCDKLETVDIRNSLSIPNQCFYDCQILKSIRADEAKSIGSYAFYNMDSEDYSYESRQFTLSFPKVEKIGFNAFYDVKGLTEINLPECKSIGNYAFYGCINLNTVNVSKLEFIGDYVFDGTNNINSLYIPNCQNIGTYNFYNNSHMLDELTIADGCVINSFNFNLGVKKVIGKPSYIGNNCFNGIYTPDVYEIDLSEVTHIGNNSIGGHSESYFTLKGDIVDLKKCQSIGTSNGSNTSFYIKRTIKKVWIPGDCIIYYNNSNNLYGFNRAECHIYTDAETKPAGWSSICTNATWHFGATHEEFEEA